MGVLQPWHLIIVLVIVLLLFGPGKLPLLGKAIGSDNPLDMKSAGNVVPKALLDAPKSGMEGLRAVALAGLTNTGTRPPVADPEPFDLEMFANTVKAVARTSPTGRFGDNKVFISHVWRQVRHEPQFAPLGLDGFKAKLVEANRENLLVLSRADMPEVLPPSDLDDSETTYQNTVYHFILLDKE